MLNAIREDIINYINENSYEIKAFIRAKKDNGYGIQIPDLTKVPVETTLGTARICRRKLPDVILTNAKSPYDHQDVYYILAAYDATWLKQGLVFEYNGQKFKTNFVENRIVEGSIAYKLADLDQVTSGNVGDYVGY